MADDEILDELHRVREQLVAEAGGDIAGLFQLLRATAHAEGQKTVSLPAKVPAERSSEAA
ncbi:MAG: hypothetical protein WAM82_30050 [Thermoanaerobaculia bacterium]